MLLEEESDGYLDVIPDVVVEIVSPSDSQREVNDKTQMWLNQWSPDGCDGLSEDTHRHRPPPGVPALTLAGDDALDGGDVLPGFSLPLSEIFDA